MTILKKEVKTFYNISFTSCEFLQIVQAYASSSTKHRHAKAFESLDCTEEIKVREVHKFFTEMGIFGNGDTFAYIAEYFGFDGWQNAGYYNKAKECYCMTVFDYGDQMN